MHPVAETPLHSFHLPVGEGHRLFVHTYGNPNGLPVVVLHGGPGGGSNIKVTRYFDPARTHVILFDQRGCGQSHWPDMSLTGRVQANTTTHLVADIETLRQHLGIDQWLVYGTSWGSTLALAYAQAHADHVHGLVVGGILLGTQAERRWFAYPDGLPRFYPQAYADLLNLLPPGTDGTTLPAAAYAAMLGADAAQAARVVRAWSYYECLAMDPVPDLAELEAMLANIDWLLPHSLLECHYLHHNWFLSEGQLLANAVRLAAVPMTILHTQYDMVCPPVAAHALHAVLPHSRLLMLPTGGHRADATMDDARAHALRQMIDALTDQAGS